jgi:hypothetical protein
MAGVSASVGGVIEVGADVEASLSGDLSFAANEYGDFLPFNEWLITLKDISGNPEFFRGQFSLDGSFDIGVTVQQPFEVEVPGTFSGGFGVSSESRSPFVLDFKDPNLTSRRPDLFLEIDLPEIGDIRNLSFADVVRLLKQALEFLVGGEEEDSATSCSGGLLGKEFFGENVFTYQIPVVGVSACDSASFLQVVVDAVDALVTECNCEGETDGGGETTVSFSSLEVKLESLLQDGVGGTPDVGIVTRSNSVRSELEFDIELS